MPVWVVVVTGDGDVEVAAAFTDHFDASRYAAWWNREEIRRYGHTRGGRAAVEEIDFYPTGSWRQPRTSMRLCDAEHGDDRRSTR